jgi:uncharacterized Zn-finger protein
MSMEKEKTISCAGGVDLNSKHPLVYLNVNSKKEIHCPYCSKKFIVRKRNNKTYVEALDNVKAT